MKKVKTKNIFFVILTLGIFVLVGCGGTSSTSSTQTSTTTAIPVSTQAAATSTEQPVPTISSAQASTSDIPDSQVFVTYISAPGKYQFVVPEGWAQTTNATDVSFISNLNALQVTLTKASTQPTANSVRIDQAITLEHTGRAVRDMQIRDVQLPSGPVVLILYSSNSDPNSVTGKQVRLENNRYLFYKNGMLATLTLSAPVGADNVDQWARISQSFRWM
jgi:hypothetical protein